MSVVNVSGSERSQEQRRHQVNLPAVILGLEDPAECPGALPVQVLWQHCGSLLHSVGCPARGRVVNTGQVIFLFSTPFSCSLSFLVIITRHRRDTWHRNWYQVNDC